MGADGAGTPWEAHEQAGTSQVGDGMSQAVAGGVPEAADAAVDAGALVTVGPSTAGALLAAMHGGGEGALGMPKPFSQPICLVEHTRVAGTTHVRGIEELAHALHEGDRLRLERDAVNTWDRWSIRVLDAKGKRLGFVAADVNEIPARLMDGGKHLFAQVESVEMRGEWVRIEMGVWLDD